MPTYTLTYFNARARGEPIRMLFALAGVEYEDKRIAFSDWKDLKPKTPMGGLPILEIDGDGTKYCQCNAIARYIARKHGFGGKSELDQLRVDMIVDSVDDLLKVLFTAAEGKSDEERVVIRKKFVEEDSHKVLEKLEALLKQNKGGDGWFVGDDITLADVHFQNWSDMTANRFGMPLELAKHPKLQALKKRVEDHPKIAAWFAKRPE